jgi:hypothetical protein
MRTDCLESIRMHFPRRDGSPIRELLELLAPSLRWDQGVATVIPSGEGYIPQISMDPEADTPRVAVDFMLNPTEWMSVDMKNITGLERQNPLSYGYMGLDEVQECFGQNGIKITGIDHVGFNLPWFGPGLHPAIIDVRARLNRICLYHSFPSGEPWDFILPGQLSEIRRRKATDYHLVRRPKFEMVSFDKASTPLIQIEAMTNKAFGELRSLFPRGLADEKVHNLWLYIDNPLGIDLCLVLNEPSEADWSELFKGHRFWR